MTVTFKSLPNLRSLIEISNIQFANYQVSAMLSLARIATRNLAQVKNYHTVTSPPKNRVGLAHKAVHMALIAGAMMSVPAYICVNFKNYRGQA